MKARQRMKHANLDGVVRIAIQTLRLWMIAAIGLLNLAAIGVRQGSAEEPKKSDDAQQVIGRALEFLEKDAAKWRTERGCATCHHGTMTVWALSEAKNQGYVVGAETLANTVQWTKAQFLPQISKPRDPRPGWNAVNVSVLYLGIMSQSLPILSRDEINGVAEHLARYQEEDGGWQMRPPEGTGSPPTWESRETMALLALLAWEPFVPADPVEADAARVSRDKAVAWLNNNKPTDTTQAASLRLLLDVRMRKSAQLIQHGTDALLKRQNADGGWSPIKDLPSDAYATGQALWVLSFAGVTNDRPEIQRAVAFLVAGQGEDGSWPMACRSHPGIDTTRKRNPVPITYFGSAWATLGLVRSVPPTLDIITRQQQAIDEVRRLSGKFELDEKSPDKPVIRVTISYELDDEDLRRVSARLSVLSQLATLEFRSPKITDAGLVHLKVLPQLRHLGLENAAITDAGLPHLKAMTYLDSLNLKGTKVTDAGRQEIERALPNAKVER